MMATVVDFTAKAKMIAGSVTRMTGTCTMPNAIASSDKMPAPGIPTRKKPIPQSRACTNATPMTPFATDFTVAAMIPM